MTSTENDTLVFIFKNIIECNRFYKFSLKARKNTLEKY